MELTYLIATVIACFAFLFSILRKRSAGVRAKLYKLENETTALEVALQTMQEEYDGLKQNVAQMQGTITKHEEMEAVKMQEESAAAAQKEARQQETFADFLLRKGYVTLESIQKVQEYKKKTNSEASVSELLVMLDHINAEDVGKAKAEYQEGQ